VVTLAVIDARLERIEASLHRLLQGEHAIMSDQAHIDAEVDSLTKATADISTEIDALKAAHPNVDFTKLDAAVGAVQSLDSANQPPPPPAGP